MVVPLVGVMVMRSGNGLEGEAVGGGVVGWVEEGDVA